ncbi:unnamed protein product [Microthlaspi erraticum]|uniref:Reverse transcriptase Ty1/copia-type domain-containing protein n=1 Tax=Microthlaspi erraticum TaxID=1685480 RepID=A0A6D2HEL9_9BRAS|nr:unnamed protein product [Microthlaspi erraticum]
MGQPMKEPMLYKALVGGLQYLSLTRADISYFGNKMSQFMHKPTYLHWGAVKRVLRYLSGTPHLGVFFPKSNTSALHAYMDADWGGDKDDYISTCAYIVYYEKHPIAWSSKKQKGISRSSTEAEYRAFQQLTVKIGLTNDAPS